MSPLEEKIFEYKKLLLEISIDSWIKNDFLTVRWWVLMTALVIPWFLFYLLVDKKRLKEILLYGLVTSSIAILLDEMGSQLELWTYQVKVIPFLPRLIPVNYSMVPIIFMLIYQYFYKWKSFIIVNIILAAVFSYVLEPVLVLAKLYTLIKWRHIYSIPTYFISAVLIKLFVEKVKRVQSGAREKCMS